MAEPRTRCELCGTWTLAVAILDHLRLMHPDEDRELETWPDGEIVITDHTLTPQQFGDTEGTGRD